jgi:hypothetical protein
MINSIELSRIVNQVEIASGYDLLDYSGDDWPQANPILNLEHWDWTQIV